MLAFFAFVFDVNEQYSVHEGSLFTLPIELKDKYRLTQYARNETEGWSVGEFGYLSYMRRDHLGRKYVLPGLYLVDGPKPTKKFYGYQPNLTKLCVEKYLEQHLQMLYEAQIGSDMELTALVHDLRHLSSSIYHSATEADFANKSGDKNGVTESIKTVVATQTMLKVRIDYLDFANDTDRFSDEQDIPVYRRVDKVVRCFRASAADKNVTIDLRGNSFRLARGPNILDIVPYTIIDNAIKYSPRNRSIIVEFRDLEESTQVIFQSVGPKIAETEKETIFRRGQRGESAVQMRPSGTGLGLAVAKEIVDIFSGRLEVSTISRGEEERGIELEDIYFALSLPTEARTNGKFQHRRRSHR